MRELAQSRRWCRRVMQERAKSFFFATRILPRSKRDAVEALYGFCRYTDDIADAPHVAGDRIALLEDVAAQLDAIERHEPTSALPWSCAFADAVQRYNIDVNDARRLVRGCRSDLGVVAMPSLAALEWYAGDVAGTVGRCVMPILGAADADSLERAERLGVAMQLTNVLRDVDEDAALGRMYLPPRAPERDTVDTMREVAVRARTYYGEATVLAGRVPNDGSRVALLLARDLYEAILDRIERRHFVVAERAIVPLPSKLRFAVRSFVAAYAGRATIR